MAELISRRKTGLWLDGFAVLASVTCMVHCVGLPLLFALLPVMAGSLDPGENFHLIMLCLAVPTSLWALINGWRDHHILAPLYLGGAGLAALGAGWFFGEVYAVETTLTVAGGFLLSGAHVLNWRAGRWSDQLHRPDH